MKSRSLFFGRLFLPAALISLSGSAQALTKLNNATSLNAAGSWVENTAPLTTDVLLFNSTGVPTAGGLSVAVGAAGFIGGTIQVTNIQGNLAITQSNGQTWSISGSGIDMSAAAADVTIGGVGTTAFVRWATANTGAINVASGRILTINSNVSNQGNTKTIALTGGGNIIFNGANVGGGGAMGFSVQGGTSVTMNNTTAGWSGASAKEVINGTLNLGSDTALGSATLGLGGTNASTPTITASGGARTIANNINLLAVSIAGNATIAGSNALTINGIVTNSGSSRTLSVNNSALTTFGTGGVALSESATNRTLTINGSGNTTISGVVVNGSTSTASNLTYSGSGTLALSNANTFGGTLTASSGTTRIDNTLAAQNATVSVGAANALTFGTGITTATFAGLSGAGDLALTNTDTNAVTLSVGNNNAGSTYTGALSGAGSLTKIGAGTLTLNGNSSAYVGGVALNNGTLSIGNSNGAGTSASTITAVTGTTVFANSGISGNTVAAAISLSGTNANVTLTNGNASGGFGSAISGSADQTVTISQAGGQNVNLNATNKQLQNFYGTVSIASGQNLAFRATNLNNGSDNALFEVNGGLSTRNNGNVALGALSGSGTVSMGNSAGNNLQLTYTIGARGTNTTFSGVIQEADAANGKIVNVTKTGSGIQTFSGANTYTGKTTINGGTLALTGSGSLASPTIIVGATTTFDVSGVTGGFSLASGQSISGSGTVAGAMNIVGTLSPGNSPGTLTTGSQTWLDGGDYNWQMLDATGLAGTGYDTIAVTGTLDLSSLTTAQFGINLWSLSSISPDVNGNALNFNNLLPQSWTILTTSAGITGFDAADFLISIGANNGTGGFSNLLDGGSFSLGQTGNDLVLTYSAVPEPSAAMLLGSFGLFALLRRRLA